ncbi:MAG: membrane protein [Acidimicrobiales bacterium]|nr:MAG: membrane protein [Acidimicrobiales bacterium]
MSITDEKHSLPPLGSRSSADVEASAASGRAVTVESPSRRRYGYRPALDGLRAIAVLAVLFYHHDPRGFAPGGFLGVDLFFVLSGFLITTLLLAEHEQTGRVDLRDFWYRRARRLLPALVLVLFFVGVYAWVWAEPNELENLRADGLATLFYVSNWWFAYSGQSYFEQFANPSLFRHTWSLGIEEQFYIVWPLLISLAGAVWGVRSRRLGVALASGVVASALAMAAIVDPGDFNRAYYGTDTRAQALLLGALMAWWWRRIDVDRIVADSRLQALAILGLGVFAAFVLFVDDSEAWMYRGGFLLVAVTSALVIFAASGRQDTVYARMLSASPLVGTGLISYGLYIWHWPVYRVLTQSRTGLEGPALLALRLAAVFLVAGLSFVLVEQPIRRGVLRLPEMRRMGFAGAGVMLVFFLAGTTLAAGSSDRVLDEDSQLPPPPQGLAHSGAAPVVLFGDSTAFTLGMQVDYRVVSSLYLVRSEGATRLGCGVARGQLVNSEGRIVDQKEVCFEWPQTWGRVVEEKDPAFTMLMVGAWEVMDRRVEGRVLRFGTTEWEEHLRSEMTRAVDLLTRGRRPLVILVTPCYTDAVDPERQPQPERLDRRRIDAVNRIQREVASGRPDVFLLDLAPVLDPDGTCPQRVDGVLLRDDGVHFTKAGASRVWRYVDREVAGLAARVMQARSRAGNTPASRGSQQPGSTAPQSAGVPQSGRARTGAS